MSSMCQEFEKYALSPRIEVTLTTSSRIISSVRKIVTKICALAMTTAISSVGGKVFESSASTHMHKPTEASTVSSKYKVFVIILTLMLRSSTSVAETAILSHPLSPRWSCMSSSCTFVSF